ncbi:hypothetical protein NEHOM01_0818 [Nematocida homosporus]|uniref:uncharacterized protein n=1 Tax=Nematocida homosporus TaxID=1912981 RepID=UPI00221F146D|nr:uncharacterized protein NEHOM01_0818 [Nematocida homosporus]KAI5185403.1 hypothetical protein NEHOM01_0818 [Nematocida homosporus]
MRQIVVVLWSTLLFRVCVASSSPESNKESLSKSKSLAKSEAKEDSSESPIGNGLAEYSEDILARSGEDKVDNGVEESVDDGVDGGVEEPNTGMVDESTESTPPPKTIVSLKNAPGNTIIPFVGKADTISPPLPAITVKQMAGAWSLIMLETQQSIDDLEKKRQDDYSRDPEAFIDYHGVKIAIWYIAKDYPDLNTASSQKTDNTPKPDLHPLDIPKVINPPSASGNESIRANSPERYPQITPLPPLELSETESSTGSLTPPPPLDSLPQHDSAYDSLVGPSTQSLINAALPSISTPSLIPRREKSRSTHNRPPAEFNPTADDPMDSVQVIQYPWENATKTSKIPRIQPIHRPPASKAQKETQSKIKPKLKERNKAKSRSKKDNEPFHQPELDPEVVTQLKDIHMPFATIDRMKQNKIPLNQTAGATPKELQEVKQNLRSISGAQHISPAALEALREAAAISQSYKPNKDTQSSPGSNINSSEENIVEPDSDSHSYTQSESESQHSDSYGHSGTNTNPSTSRTSTPEYLSPELNGSNESSESGESIERIEPNESSKSDEPNESSKSDEPNESSKSDDPNESSKSDEPNESSKSDEPNESSKSDEPNESSKSDEPNESSKSDEPNESSKSDEPNEENEQTKTSTNPFENTTVMPTTPEPDPSTPSKGPTDSSQDYQDLIVVESPNPSEPYAFIRQPTGHEYHIVKDYQYLQEYLKKRPANSNETPKLHGFIILGPVYEPSENPTRELTAYKTADPIDYAISICYKCTSKYINQLGSLSEQLGSTISLHRIPGSMPITLSDILTHCPNCAHLLNDSSKHACIKALQSGHPMLLWDAIQ